MFCQLARFYICVYDGKLCDSLSLCFFGETERKAFMNKSKTAITALFMIFATLLAKICGMFRDIALAGMYGTGTNEAIAFSTASRIPLLFFDIALGSAVTSAFIPIFNEILTKDGRKKAIEFSNCFINLVLLITVIMTAIGICFSENFVNLIAGGYTEDKIALSSSLTKILFPTIIFTGLAYCFVGILQSFGEFYIPSVISLVSNGLLIIYLLVVGNRFGIHGVAIAMLVSWSTQFLVQLPSLKKTDYTYSLRAGIKNDGIKRVCFLALPIIISTWVQPINTMINIRLASGMEGGSAVTALDYANKLYIILVGVFTFVITNLIFPSLSRAFAKKNSEEYKSIVRKAISYVLFIITPVMVGFLILSRPIISFFYERGAFDEYSTTLTATALFFYSLGMLGYGISEICNKTFYAMQDGKSPMAISVIGVGINVVLSIFLVNVFSFGHWALAFSASVSANLMGITMLIVLNRRIKFMNIQMMFSFAKVLISAILMGIVVYATKTFLIGYTEDKIIILFLPIIAGGITYLAASYILKSEEFKEVLVLIKNKVKGGKKDEQ